MARANSTVRILSLLLFGLLIILTYVNLRYLRFPSDLISVHQTKDDSAEKVRHQSEGILWVDRATGQYVVTLGATNGIYPGKRLNVFHGERFIGEVLADVVFESISYVRTDQGSGLFDMGDYYKVAVGKEY